MPTARKARKSKKGKPRIVKLEALQQINFNAAGLDIGAAEIWVAIPEERDPEPVRVFETFTVDLHAVLSQLIPPNRPIVFIICYSCKPSTDFLFLTILLPTSGFFRRYACCTNSFSTITNIGKLSHVPSARSTVVCNLGWRHTYFFLAIYSISARLRSFPSQSLSCTRFSLRKIS